MERSSGGGMPSSLSVLPKEDTNPLVALFNEMTAHGAVGAAFLFVVSAGLLAAMLSTASTQLIATTHRMPGGVAPVRFDERNGSLERVMLFGEA